MGSRDAEGHCHGNHFVASMGYSFGCMVASDTTFDSRGWVFGVKLSNDDIADFRGSGGRSHGNHF